MNIAKKNSQEHSGENPDQPRAGFQGPSRLLLGLLVAAIPALISAWLLSTQPGGDIRHYALQWSDEVYNWHQVAPWPAFSSFS